MGRYNVVATIAQTHTEQNDLDDSDEPITVTVTDVAVGDIVNVVLWDGVTPYEVETGFELVKVS